MVFSKVFANEEEIRRCERKRIRKKDITREQVPDPVLGEPVSIIPEPGTPDHTFFSQNRVKTRVWPDPGFADVTRTGIGLDPTRNRVNTRKRASLPIMILEQ